MEFLRKIKGIFIASLLFGITAFIVLIMRICPSKQRSLRRVIAKVVRTIVGYKVEFEGEFDGSSELFVLNHQSLSCCRESPFCDGSRWCGQQRW